MSTKRFIWLLGAALGLVTLFLLFFWWSGFNGPKTSPIPTFFYETREQTQQPAQDRQPN